MNKIYRLVRNRVTGEWAVASELAKSQSKGASRGGLIATVLFAANAAAQTVTVPTFDAASCDSKACATVVIGGANVTLIGPGTKFDHGVTGNYMLDVPSMHTAAVVTGGSQYVDPSNPASLVINTGGRVRAIALPGGTAYVYDNSNVVDSYATPIDNPYKFMAWHEVGDQHYIDTRIGTVDGSGGVLNVDIGSPGYSRSSDNQIDMTTKQSDLTYADGRSGNASTINWKSNNYVNLGSPMLKANGVGEPYTATFVFSAYKGTFVAFDGSSHAVNSAADLQQYNDWLVAKLQAGLLGAASYEAEFGKAYVNTPRTITWENIVNNTADDIYQAMGDRTVIHADGQAATGRVITGVHLDVDGASTSGGGKGAVMLATQGASVTNEGTIGFKGGGAGGDTFGAGLWADGTGSTAINSGVLAVSYFAGGSDGSVGAAYDADPVNPTQTGVYNRGIHVTGGATGRNDGIINVAGSWSQGFWVNNGAASNNGTVNVGVNTTADTEFLSSFTNSGAVVLSGSFVNENSGEIYLGRGAQYTTTDTPADVANGLKPLIGIYAVNGGRADNKGLITLGGQTHNSQAIIAEGTAQGVINSGTIVLNGASNLQEENVGLWSRAGATNVHNTGMIQVNGSNNIALRASDTSKADSSGTITLGGGVNGLGLHNVGLDAQGLGSTVTLMDSGSVNLVGDGVIGVRARSQGSALVNGSVNFVSGQNQIGYFADGQDAFIQIDSGAAPLDARTAGSTLLRLEDGGKADVGASRIVASGANSTGVQAVGSATLVDLDQMQVAASGAGATGVKIEGGASGQMSIPGQLVLGDNTVGIAIDNQRYDIDGLVTGVGSSTFTNSADVTVLGATNATAFSVRNGGTLVNSGDIHLSNGTGIELVGAGSTVTGDAAGQRGSITVDDGLAGIHVHAGASYVSQDRVAVNGAAVGVKVAADAGYVELGSGAHVTGNGSTYGKLVVNEGAPENVRIAGATLEMQGDGAALLATNNFSSDSSGHILVSGSTDAKGIALSQDDGSLTNASAVIGDAWDIVVSGDGAGVYANTTGSLVLDRTRIQVTGAGNAIRSDAAGTVTINAGSSLAASDANAKLIVGEMSALRNSGNVSSVNQSAVAVELSDADSTFINEGQIVGAVNLGDGRNTALLTAGSSLAGTLRGGTGDDAVTVQGNAHFATVDGAVGGNDTLIFDGATYAYNSANAIERIETVVLSNNSTVTIGRELTTADDGSDNSAVVITNGSTLAVAPASGSFVLNNAISGAGTITTDTGGGAFAFGNVNAARTGTDFTGTLALGNSSFALQGQNTNALGKGTLRIDAGSVTTVGDGEQRIGGLHFNGGTLKFNASVPDEVVATSHITVDTLDATGSGTVQVVVPRPYEMSGYDTPNAFNLLEQDDVNIGTQLVAAATTLTSQGYAGNLALVDQDGNAITNAQQVDIAQGGDVVAKGTYDYRLTTAPNEGLYVNWGLTELELQQGRTLTLAPDTGAVGAAADMSARISGDGDLAIDAGLNTVSLSNLANDYTGESTVRSGTLRLEADGALGQTSVLRVMDAAAADLNGKVQAVGALDGQSGSMLDLNGGELIIVDGGASAGSLMGAGRLTVEGGQLDVLGANNGLTAAIEIAADASVHMDDTAALGSGGIAHEGVLAVDGAQGALVNAISGAGAINLTDGAEVTLAGDNRSFSGAIDIAQGTTLTATESNNLGTAGIANDGTLVVDTAIDWTLANAVSGVGTLTKRGAGTLAAGEALTYTGETAVEAGTLVVGDATQPMVTLGGTGAGSVTVSDGATLTGLGTVSGAVTNSGTVSALNALAGQAGAPAGTFTIGSLTNQGTVLLAGASVGNTLLVKGDYVGQGGTVEINTVLGGDAWLTDKLIVEGNTAGNTLLKVNNLGGAGGYTTEDGIQVVQVAGQSNGTFELSGRVVAGAHEYLLAQGGRSNPSDGDWYLRSEAPTVMPPDPEPTPEPTPEPSCEATNSCQSTPIYRPEVGAYLGNQVAAVSMFNTTLHERLGEADYSERQRGNGANGSAWMRLKRNQFDASAGAGQLDVSSNSDLVQLGGELTHWSEGDSRFHLGAMAGMGRTITESTSSVTQYQARGEAKGYGLGVYGTWYQSASEPTGLYLDGWLHYGHFDNKVQGNYLAPERYNSQVWSTSLEAGYAAELGRGQNSAWYLEPQAQAIFTRVQSDDHVEAGGTTVSEVGAGGVTTRVGVRVYARPLDDANNRVQPFVQANWWHRAGDEAVAFEGERMDASFAPDIYEVKAGAQLELGQHLTGWGELGVQSGAGDHRNVNGTIGVKYSW